MAIGVRPLSNSVGAEVTGLDLRLTLPPELVGEIKRAWDRYGVLVFRDQELTREQQTGFTKSFGRLRVGRAGVHEGNDFVYVGNVTIDGVPGEFPKGEMLFHQDGFYAVNPARASLLYALEVPSIGGNTVFCSTGRAFAALESGLQSRLLDYDILFSHRYGAVQRDAHTRPNAAYAHPLVIAHPSTGRPLLVCSRLMADSIIGLPPAESDALIARLLAEVERRDEVYEHVWHVGDLVAWDNLAVQHARTDFDPAERRALRRQQLVGDPLVAYRDTVRAAAS